MVSVSTVRESEWFNVNQKCIAILYICPFVCLCVLCVTFLHQFHRQGILSFGDPVGNPPTVRLDEVMSPALFVFRHIGMAANNEANRRITSYVNNTSQMRDAQNFIRSLTGDMDFTATIIIIAEWRRLRFACCDLVSFKCTCTHI